MLEKSQWIASGKAAECPVFSKNFRAERPVRRALLKITAAGVYEARLNGARVGQFFLAPGWTNYFVRHQVQEYDVTGDIRPENELNVTVASGWFNGAIAHPTAQTPPVLLIAELNIFYADGSTATIVTDNSWLCTESPVRYADIYNGEEFDAAFSDENPAPAIVRDYPKEQLIPQQGEEVHLQEQLRPVRVIHTPAGETVLDFGQEITGIVRLSVNAKRGDTITLHCAEVLDKDGNFYTANYRAAKSTMTLHCRDGAQTWQPALTFYGFRYIQVVGWPEKDLQPDAFTAIVASSDLRRTGWLTCGSAKLNRLFENTIWSQKDNFLDIPTDCPQRDERRGWTGDAQVFMHTACYQFDTKKFFEKWLADMMAEQRSTGALGRMIPMTEDPRKSPDTTAGAAWGDAATICPWQLFRHYGDRGLLATHFTMMKRWVDYITSVTTTPDLWTGYNNPELGHRHYGDWLGMDAPEGSCLGSTDQDLIATAFYAYSTQLVCKAGHALGENVSRFEQQYARIVAAFREKYPTYPTQTGCALAVYFDLAADRQAAADHLAELVHSNGDRLTTGFVGTPYLLYALSENGHMALAYTLLLQERFPSWLFSVNHGATTTWEHWDGKREDGSFWSESMNSFNHYAYGSVAGWVFEVAAGVEPVEEAPGFERVRIAPHPDERLGWLRAVVDTPHGQISSEWHYEDARIRYQITTSVDAEIVLDGKTRRVAPGTYLF